ncbi:hypothetical protein MSI_01890 [Treponema sp. JC4]|uniref:hypothetical protein n=1 Tax=Treponema sp. JC4 TaxID=1124982 RepID=UPI00025B0BAB|nr:hypothetical protein [Treponema sp. JC4]EID86233.1 hypothetical protein MSI_01890 [Treponema sp. JC4]
MKKIVGMIAAAALAATAFAEINIGSWNRAVFVPFAYDGDTVRTLEGVSWSGTNYGGAGVRTGLGFSASTENAGMVMDVHANPDNSGSSLGLGDNAYVWVKPVEMFRVAFGKIDNNWGRLDHCFGTWDTWRFGNDLSVGEGFAGVERQKGTGANFTLTPVEGLVIDYEANFDSGNDDGTYGNARAYEVFWEKGSLMVGYNADFGFIRAIVNGQRAGTNKDGDSVVAAKISVAADITAVENMTFKVGATIPTNLTGYNADGSKNSVKFGAGADFAFDPATIHAQAEFAINPKEVDTDNSVKLGDLGFRLGAGVDFNINDALAAVADFRFGSNKYMGEKKDAFGIYAGLKQKLTNATFDFGVMMGKNVGPSISAEKAADEPFTVAVPLTITASF